MFESVNVKGGGLLLKRAGLDDGGAIEEPNAVVGTTGVADMSPLRAVRCAAREAKRS